MKKEDVKEEVVTGFDSPKVDEDFKAKKREAAARFAEKQKALKVERVEAAKELIKVLTDKGIFATLPESSKNLLNGLVNAGKPAAATSGLFTAIFGANAKVGDSVTLQDIFNKTFKGQAEVAKYIKKWAEKGIVVSCDVCKENLLNSKYTIDKLA